MSLKPLTIGNDRLIDTIFDICQTDLASPGLMLEDVKRENCANLADQLVGMRNEEIEPFFEQVDANGDGIVMRYEVFEAFQALAREESGEFCMGYYQYVNGKKQPGTYYGEYKKDKCKRVSTDCCKAECSECDCPKEFKC